MTTLHATEAAARDADARDAANDDEPHALWGWIIAALLVAGGAFWAAVALIARAVM